MVAEKENSNMEIGMEQVNKSRRALIISYVTTITISLAIAVSGTEAIMRFCFNREMLSYYSNAELMGFRIMFIVLIFAVMFIALILPVSWKFRKKYSRDFRGCYFGAALRKSFENVEHDSEKGFDKNFIENLGIINTGYRFRSDNFFKCSNQNFGFEMADIKVDTYWVQEAGKAIKKKSMTNPVVLNRVGYGFHGQLMILDTNKSCRSDIKIVPNSLSDTNLSSTFDGNRIETGLPEFDRKFIVYDDDPQEAHEILTNDLLTQLSGFAKKADCRYYFAFEGKKLYIGVHSFGMGKYLKVGSSFKKSDSQKIQTEAEDNVKDIKTLLEYLNR